MKDDILQDDHAPSLWRAIAHVATPASRYHDGDGGAERGADGRWQARWVDKGNPPGSKLQMHRAGKFVKGGVTL